MTRENPSSEKKPNLPVEPKPVPIAKPNPMAVNIIQEGLTDAGIEKRGKT